MQLTWFRAPSGDDAGTLNVCFHAVDLHVVRGAAEQPAVRHGSVVLDHATLLEQVAALGGALRGLGVEPGQAVAGSLADPLDDLLLLLACLRLAATYVALPDDPGPLLARHTPRVVATSRPLDLPADGPAACLVRGLEPRDVGRDLDWDVALRAGRTDPAPCRDQGGDAVALAVDGVEVRARDVLDHPSRRGRRLATLAAGDLLDLTGVGP